MQYSSDHSARPVKLNCFEGQPAPSIVIAGWKTLKAFPPASWESFWHLLAPVLITADNAINQELVTLFCDEHDILPEQMISAIGCCQLLLKQAAALDLSPSDFQQDLESLTDEPSDELAQFIQSRYPDAKKGLRRHLLLESLYAHGKVMTGLEWRLDKVQHASKGRNLNTDIVMLTLHYQEGQNHDAITLQLTEEAAQALKGFCARLDARSK